MHGQAVDDQTRCVHWHSALDIVAIKFACCGRYYPCFSCHEAAVSHEPRRWPVDAWGESAILCGVCRTELTITEYRAVSGCPSCGAAFNPGCGLHAHLYFEEPPPTSPAPVVPPG